MSPTVVGARLRCESCGTEIIVVKATDAEVGCCGQAMVAKKA